MIASSGAIKVSPPVPSRPNPWIVVALLFVVACLNYLDRVMLTTMRSSVVAAIPMTDTQFGLLMSGFLWVYALMSPVGGFLADRISRSKVIVWSLFLWSAVTWMTSRATTFEELLATRILMGFGEACYIPAAVALISDYHRGVTRSLATGIHMTGISLGQALGGFGGVLADKHEWSYAFSLFGIFGVLYGVLLACTLRDAPPDSVQGPVDAAPKVQFLEAIRSLFSSRSYCCALGFWGLLSFASWCIVGWLPTFWGERFHLSQGTAGLSATVYLQIAAAAGFLVAGFLSDRASRGDPWGRLRVTMIGIAISAPAIFLGSNATTFSVAILGFMLWAFGNAFASSNMMPMLCLISDPRYRATGYGILNLCSCTIGGLSTYLGGVVRDRQIGVLVIFNTSVGVIFLCCVLLYFMKPRQGETSAAQ